uniref:Secreted protein n=1 Tax=Knipowitschia caucasica TaxID=637954 RepID=A0AAV2M2M4_KNICA
MAKWNAASLRWKGGVPFFSSVSVFCCCVCGVKLVLFPTSQSTVRRIRIKFLTFNFTDEKAPGVQLLRLQRRSHPLCSECPEGTSLGLKWDISEKHCGDPQRLSERGTVRL